MRCTSLSILLVLVACGGDDGPPTQIGPDAAVTPDAPPLPPGCDYAELADLMNDGFGMNAQRETTGLSTTQSFTICGNVDTAATDGDIDSYRIDVPADASVIVRVTGAGLENLAYVSADVYAGEDYLDGVTFANFVGTHGVTAATFASDDGPHEISIYTETTTPITAPIPYKLTVTIDTPATRCPPSITAAATYTEARDTGADATLNDVVIVDFSAQDPAMQQILTAATTDAPEPSGITLAASQSVRLSGTLAPVAAVGSYKDKDTFLFTTGPGVNEIEVRQTWTGAVADYDADLRIFEVDRVPNLHAAATATPMEEFQTFAVKPNTMYWLWTGLYEESTGTNALPYDIAVCGKTFAP